MQKIIIIISTLVLFLGGGCLTEEEADEVQVFVQDFELGNDNSSVVLDVTVMYKGNEKIEGTVLVCYLKYKEFDRWYATGITDEIVIGQIENGFNEMYHPSFLGLGPGQYQVIIEVVDKNNETRGDVTSPDIIIN